MKAVLVMVLLAVSGAIGAQEITADAMGTADSLTAPDLGAIQARIADLEARVTALEAAAHAAPRHHAHRPKRHRAA